LRNFYVKHKIGLYATNYVYQQSRNAKTNDLRRFAIEIGDLVEKDKPIVYFDESSFNMWMRKSKTWMRYNEPIPVVLNKTRGENVTVYGAIGVCLSKALFLQTKVTNEQATINFMKKLREHANKSMKPNEQIHLILDNHAAHHTIEMREVFENLNFIPHFMPPYSPQFNSIEALWGIIKRRVKDRMALAPGTIE
jgi:transposase